MSLIGTFRKYVGGSQEAVRNLTKLLIQARESKKEADMRENTPRTKGYYRSSGYIAPVNWYNHKSGNFMRNKRRGM